MVFGRICCVKQMGRKVDSDSEAEESLLRDAKLAPRQPVDK